MLVVPVQGLPGLTEHTVGGTRASGERERNRGDLGVRIPGKWKANILVNRPIGRPQRYGTRYSP